jgi:hypothetical protein
VVGRIEYFGPLNKKQGFHIKTKETRSTEHKPLVPLDFRKTEEHKKTQLHVSRHTIPTYSRKLRKESGRRLRSISVNRFSTT